jgi:hypothetical protein
MSSGLAVPSFSAFMAENRELNLGKFQQQNPNNQKNKAVKAFHKS